MNHPLASVFCSCKKGLDAFSIIFTGCLCVGRQTYLKWFEGDIQWPEARDSTAGVGWPRFMIWYIPIIDSICHLWGASPEIDIAEMVVCWRKAIDIRIQILRNSQHFLWRLSTKIRIQKMIHQCQSFIIHHPITDGVKQKTWTVRLKTSRAANCLGLEGGRVIVGSKGDLESEPCLPVEKFVTKKRWNCDIGTKWKELCWNMTSLSKMKMFQMKHMNSVYINDWAGNDLLVRLGLGEPLAGAWRRLKPWGQRAQWDQVRIAGWTLLIGNRNMMKICTRVE